MHYRNNHPCVIHIFSHADSERISWEGSGRISWEGHLDHLQNQISWISDGYMQLFLHTWDYQTG